jgi:site-specific recombinase XerD
VGSEEFTAAYHAAVRGEQADVPKRAVPRAGSFRAACIGYYASEAYRWLDKSTQDWQRRALDGIALLKGESVLRELEPRHVRQFRDDKKATPAAANTMLKALRALFVWAVDAKLADTDPTREVKRVKYVTKGHHSWSLDEVEKYEARHPLGTKARLAMAILLYTTGRREDAPRLGRQHTRNDRVKFTQAKNEHRSPVEIDIPLHPDLAAAIAAGPNYGTPTFLVTEYGRPFSTGGFGNKFREWCDQAGLTHCSAHGLRKAMAARLAERGATDHEIMAWTGHQTLAQVQHYTKAARRKLMADSALQKLIGRTQKVPL